MLAEDHRRELYVMGAVGVVDMIADLLDDVLEDLHADASEGVDAEVLDNHVETGITFLQQRLNCGCGGSTWYRTHRTKLEIGQTRALLRALLEIAKQSSNIHVSCLICQ